MASTVFPMGFHAGVGGYFPTDLIEQINQRGFRAFVKVIDDEGRAAEALRIGDRYGQENVVVFRVTKRDGVETEAPQKHEKTTPAEWWGRHMRFISPSLDKRIWLELANETDRNTYDWQGQLFFEVARDHALPAGWRICAPGSNSGEPESWAGWENYLRLCAEQPDRVAISLHFYAWGIGQKPEENWDTYYPDHVGRESKIYDLCDQLKIAYPVIHITEGGFAHNDVPDWSPGNVVDQYMRKLANHVAVQPNMTGIGFWCCQPYQGNIHHEFNSTHVPRMKAMAAVWQAPAELPREKRERPTVPGGGQSPAGQKESPADGGGEATAAASTDSAGGALTGLVARDFGLGHDNHPNLLRVNEPIWFHFEVQNTSGGDKPYGGLGVLAWRWHEGQWKKFRWQNSFGGFNDKFAGGQTLRHGDHMRLSEQGIFALSLAITTDGDAHNKTDQPDAIGDLQILRDPIYVDLGPHFANGKEVTQPPAPLFKAASTGGTGAAGKPDGTGKPGGTGKSGGTGKPGGSPARGQRQVIYFLAPQGLSRDERLQVYDLAWEGIRLADGSQTAGKHTVTFSHTDAFDAVRHGAPGSIVYIVEPQRIGSGITHEWMAANAPDIDHGLVDLTQYLAGAADASSVRQGSDPIGRGAEESGGGTASIGKREDTDGGAGWTAPSGELVAGWGWADNMTRSGNLAQISEYIVVRAEPNAKSAELGYVYPPAIVRVTGERVNSRYPIEIATGDLKADPPEQKEAPTDGGKARPQAPAGRYSGPQVTFHAGIHGPGDAITWHNPAFRNMLANLNIPVKFMSDADRNDFYPTFNKPELELVRIFWKPDFSRVKSAQEAWEEDIRDGVLKFYGRGARNFEVHNEPRLGHEGMGHQWHDGAQFGKFLRELMLLIKKSCPDAKLWYPGESPGVPWTDQFAFSKPAYAAVADLCYGVCQHAYSGTTNNAGQAVKEIVDQVRDFRKGLSSDQASAWDKPIIVSESSVNRAASAEYRAKVYAGVAKELAKIPGVKGIFWYISHWNAPDAEKANAESWFGTDIDVHYKRLRA